MRLTVKELQRVTPSIVFINQDESHNIEIERLIFELAQERTRAIQQQPPIVPHSPSHLAQHTKYIPLEGDEGVANAKGLTLQEEVPNVQEFANIEDALKAKITKEIELAPRPIWSGSCT